MRFEALDNQTDSLEEQIFAHEQRNLKQSYLDKTIEFVNVFQSDNKRLDQLKRARDGASPSAVAQMVQDDKNSLAVSDAVNHYVGSFAKIAPLFMAGPAGWLGTAGVYAFDQARPSDSMGNQIVDGALGAAKGLAMKEVITSVGSQNWNFAMKGAALGISNRLLDTALTRQSYLGEEERFDMARGVSNIVATSLNPRAVAMDALVFGASLGVGKLAAVSPGLSTLISSRPLYSMMASGAVFGGTSGAMSELDRQWQEGQFSFGKLILRTGLEATVYTAAAAAGGLQAERYWTKANADAARRNEQEGDAPEKSGADSQVPEGKAASNRLAEAPPAQRNALETLLLDRDNATKLADAEPVIEKPELVKALMKADAKGTVRYRITAADGTVSFAPQDSFKDNFNPESLHPNYYTPKTRLALASRVTAPIEVITTSGMQQAQVGDYVVDDGMGALNIVPGKSFAARFQAMEAGPPSWLDANRASELAKSVLKHASSELAVSADAEAAQRVGKIVSTLGDWFAGSPWYKQTEFYQQYSALLDSHGISSMAEDAIKQSVKVDSNGQPLLDFYVKHGMMEQAEKLQQSKVDGLESRGKQDRLYLAARDRLGQIQQDSGNLDKAEETYKDTLALRAQGRQARYQINTANTSLLLADLQDAQGHPEQAEATRLQTIDHRLSTLPGQNAPTMGIMDQLTAQYTAEGRYADAETMGKRALELPGVDKVANRYENLAELQMKQGKLDAARDSLVHSVDTSSETNVSRQLGKLAGIYARLGQLARANQLAELASRGDHGDFLDVKSMLFAQDLAKVLGPSVRRYTH
jgi:tetratricopeptide (TPR) repeat protein